MMESKEVRHCILAEESFSLLKTCSKMSCPFLSPFSPPPFPFLSTSSLPLHLLPPPPSPPPPFSSSPLSQEKTLNMEISAMIGIGLYQLQFANNDELDITRRKMVAYVHYKGQLAIKLLYMPAFPVAEATGYLERVKSF